MYVEVIVGLIRSDQVSAVSIEQGINQDWKNPPVVAGRGCDMCVPSVRFLW